MNGATDRREHGFNKKDLSTNPAQSLEARTIRPPFYILFVADQNCVTTRPISDRPHSSQK